jgi:hypothetical protein
MGKKHRDRSKPAPRIVAVSPDDGSAIDLKNPALAALLSWCLPGLGQIYQGRLFKGRLFMGAILGTFIAGLWLGGGRVVYASWTPGNTRWAYVCQAGAGLVALPAMLQSLHLQGPAKQPFFVSSFMAPPLTPGQYVSRDYATSLASADPDIEAEDFFDRPPWRQSRIDEVSIWHRRFGRWFEIGTLYTMLAGMLNMLVIYDAWAGPLGMPTDDERKAHRNAASAASQRKEAPK